MAKLTTEEFIAAIKELSVLELNDLVKACEEEFGSSRQLLSQQAFPWQLVRMNRINMKWQEESLP